MLLHLRIEHAPERLALELAAAGVTTGQVLELVKAVFMRPRVRSLTGLLRVELRRLLDGPDPPGYNEAP